MILQMFQQDSDTKLRNVIENVARITITHVCFIRPRVQTPSSGPDKINVNA